MHFVPKLAIEVAAVLFGVCVGFVKLARKRRRCIEAGEDF
jgi:hypothetical protein